MIYLTCYLLTSIKLCETEYLLFLSVCVVDPEGELQVPVYDDPMALEGLPFIPEM